MEEPLISKDFITYVNKIYPDILPSYLSKPHSLYFLQGQISVVRHIKNLYKKQQDRGSTKNVFQHSTEFTDT